MFVSRDIQPERDQTVLETGLETALLEVNPVVSKPTVLLLHGLTGVPTELQSIARPLRRGGYHVETPLLPGHGLNEAALVKTGWRDWLRGAEEELFMATADGNPAIVGGLSVGAVIALRLAQKHPERVRAVVSLAATLRYDGWSVPKIVCVMPYFRHVPFVNRMQFKEHPPYGIKDERLRAKIAEMLFSDSVKDVGLPSTPGISMLENIDLVKIVEKKLGQIKVPVFICHAREDDITHVRNAERLAARLGGVVKTLYLEDSYHLITVDQERNKVGKAVLDFCDELMPSEKAL